jgi:hypothetical protein
LFDVSEQHLQLANQPLGSLVQIPEPFFRQQSKFRSQRNQVVQFRRGTAGDVEETEILARCSTGRSFDDVAGDRDGGPSHLRPESEPFFLREGLRLTVDSERQLMCVVKHAQLPMVSGHVLLDNGAGQDTDRMAQSPKA